MRDPATHPTLIVTLILGAHTPCHDDPKKPEEVILDLDRLNAEIEDKLSNVWHLRRFSNGIFRARVVYTLLKGVKSEDGAKLLYPWILIPSYHSWYAFDKAEDLEDFMAHQIVKERPDEPIVKAVRKFIEEEMEVRFEDGRVLWYAVRRHVDGQEVLKEDYTTRYVKGSPKRAKSTS